MFASRAAVVTVLRYTEVIRIGWPTILNAGLLGALLFFFVSESILGKYFGEPKTDKAPSGRRL